MKKIFCLIMILYFVSNLAFSQDKDHKLLPVKVNCKWGFINQTGKLVIKPQFDGTKDFSEGLAAVKINDKWGFINADGKMVIDPQFNSCQSFMKNGLCVVTQLNKPFKVSSAFDKKHDLYINKKGEFVFTADSIKCGDISDGMIAFRNVSENKYGYYNSSFQIVITPQFDEAMDFKEGVACVKLNKKFGFIDRAGEFIIEPKFDEVPIINGGFREGFATVKFNNKWGFINKKGEFVIKPQYDVTWNYKEGVARFKLNDKVGFVDNNFRIIIQPQFEYATDFKEGFASVRNNSEWLINKQGVQISKKYASVSTPNEDMAVFQKEEEGQYGFINTKGEEVIPVQFDNVSKFSGGIAQVTVGEKMGYIDKTGKYIWEPTE